MYDVMEYNIKNWLTQIKKGYLDLCILALVDSEGRAYGLQMIQSLEEVSVSIKEGTLYPLLNRMTKEGLLSSSWETPESQGHPRKFYSLTSVGKQTLLSMQAEYQSMYKILQEIAEREVKASVGSSGATVLKYNKDRKS